MKVYKIHSPVLFFRSGVANGSAHRPFFHSALVVHMLRFVATHLLSALEHHVIKPILTNVFRFLLLQTFEHLSSEFDSVITYCRPVLYKTTCSDKGRS